MLFNSYEFLFFFLPVVAAGFFAIGYISHGGALVWLALSSFAFYAAPYALYGQFGTLPIWLLVLSVVANYWAGRAIISLESRSAAKSVTAAAIGGDLAVLGYFKYSGFLVENVAEIVGSAIPWQVVLPIGISFYTFTQIAFLVDAYRRKVYHLGFMDYALFVTWFPHLIAGPILHHAEMIGQFKRWSTTRLQPRNVAVGLAIFSVGMAKKILIADNLSPYANAVFGAGVPVSLAEAWAGVLAFTLQLYFDFSGYSDMAIGLSRLFNIELPLNFYSPYKSTSIVEFWRRWHISLSRFLRDYLYIPLGGNRAGVYRRYLNLMITMLLGGLWHGAAWTFVVWGALHGAYLLIDHAWRALRRQTNLGPLPWPAGWLLTFLSVVVAWVFFKAADLTTAIRIVEAMAGIFGNEPTVVATKLTQAPWYIAFALLIALAMPNTQQLFSLSFNPRGSLLKESRPTIERFDWLCRALCFRPSAAWALAGAAMLAGSILFLERTSEFLYFQF